MTQQGAAASAFPSTGLVSYYRFEETSGILYDAIGGVNSSSTSNLTYNQTGKNGKCIKLVKASSSKVIFANNAKQNFGTGDFTISQWINLTTLGNWGGYYAKKNSADTYGYGLTTNSSNQFEFSVFSNGYNLPQGITMRSAAVSNSGVWYHVVCVREQNYLKIYLNTTMTSQAMAAVNCDVAIDATIGTYRSPDNNNYSNGMVDEIAIWNRALTAAEVTTIYNSGAGLFY